METTFKDYPIYKKRDGKGFKEVGSIYSISFEDAKKEFAKNMTNDNWEKSNNIVWLDKENDGVEQAGWYDLDASLYGFFEEGTEKEGAPNYKYGMMDLICSEDAINEGFDYWSEDVYTWELREPLEFVEITALEDFENEKENYSYFMAVEGERFFLYNGDFHKIAELECLDGYSDTNDKFMGSPIDDVEFIENYLK